MKLGEDKLFSRYTNLRQKQEEEEQEIQMQIISSKTTTKNSAIVNKVSNLYFILFFQPGIMFDRKKIRITDQTSKT